MQVWNVLHVARWKYRTQKWCKNLGPIPQLCRAISSQLRHVSTIGKKNLLSSNICSRCPHNIVNFGLLAAEIVSGVWGTPATFNGSRVFAAFLYSSQVVSVSQTLRRWTEGATYVRQGDHHVGHWPTFLVCLYIRLSIYLSIYRFFTTPTGHIFSAILTLNGSYDVSLKCRHYCFARFQTSDRLISPILFTCDSYSRCCMTP